MKRSTRPLLISCQGASPASRLAAEIARELGALGLVETVADIESLGTHARAGRAIVALDGCSSACSFRRADADGTRLAACLNLAELGATGSDPTEADRAALIARAARRLQADSGSRRLPRPHTSRPPSPLRRGRTHNLNDYLLAIHELASSPAACGALITDAPTLAAHVSAALGVSRATAGEMLAKLESSGLIRRSSRKELVLTAAGSAVTDTIMRRHRILEHFATVFLGYPLAESYIRARTLEAAFDSDSIDRLARKLGNPERCPHGWPIDPTVARRESRHLRTLTTLAPGERARVITLTEQNAIALARLTKLRLLPGTTVTAHATATDGRQQVEILNRTVTLTKDESQAVLVHDT